MYKCLRFLSFFSLVSAYGVLFGTPYPSLEDIKLHLHTDEKEEFEAVVKKAFEDVCQQAEAPDFKNLELIGKANGALILPNGLALKYYRPQDYRDWQWKFDTIYGFFSCTVNDASVFNEETLRKAVKASETDRLGRTMLTRADTRRITEIVKVCQVLLREEFAKKLLTEPLLQALYDNEDAAYSCFDVKFFPDTIEKNAFRFDVMYSQTVKEAEREAKGASVFVLRFSFGYDFENHDFGGNRVDDNGKCWGSNQPQLEYLEVNGNSVRSNSLNFDTRLMERVWVHPYLESILCKGKENSEKSEDGLESEEEDLRVFTEEDKKDEASEVPSNKHPRSPDSEDEASEENLKRKKEERSALGTNREM